jgi:thioredoxin 1
MVVKHLATKAEFDALLKTGKAFVVDFYAEWYVAVVEALIFKRCGPCKMISPKLEALSEKSPYSALDYVKVDVDELEDLAAEQGYVL